MASGRGRGVTSNCDWLRQDETLAAIFGCESLPSQSTYSRFFGKFSQARNTAVFPPLQRWIFSQINIGAVTVDFDSTVITREGAQEGSAKGYNPNRRVLNLSLPRSKRPWMDSIFRQIDARPPPLDYSTA